MLRGGIAPLRRTEQGVAVGPAQSCIEVVPGAEKRLANILKRRSTHLQHTSRRSLERFPVGVARRRSHRAAAEAGRLPRREHDMSPSPLWGGARGGGNQHGHASPLHAGPIVGSLAGLAHQSSCLRPCDFTPPLSPPHQGEGDVVALSSPRPQRRMLCEGAQGAFFRGCLRRDPHHVKSALAAPARGWE